MNNEVLVLRSSYGDIVGAIRKSMIAGVVIATDDEYTFKLILIDGTDINYWFGSESSMDDELARIVSDMGWE